MRGISQAPETTGVLDWQQRLGRVVCSGSEYRRKYLVQLLLAVDLLRADVVKRAAQGQPAFLIEDPSVGLVNLVGIESD